MRDTLRRFAESGMKVIMTGAAREKRQKASTGAARQETRPIRFSGGFPVFSSRVLLQAVCSRSDRIGCCPQCSVYSRLPALLHFPELFRISSSIRNLTPSSKIGRFLRTTTLTRRATGRLPLCCGTLSPFRCTDDTACPAARIFNAIVRTALSSKPRAGHLDFSRVGPFCLSTQAQQHIWPV